MPTGIDWNLIVKKHWATYQGLVVVMFSFFFTFMVTIKFEIDGDYNKYLFWGLLSVVEVTVITFWVRNRKVTICKKGKIGLVFAIKGQGEGKYNETIYKLINPIIQQLNANIFDVIVLPYNQCEKINNYESARKMLDTAKSHMIIYGACNEGKKKGEECYELDLNSIILHKKLDQEAQSKFTKEFSDLIPRVDVKKNDELTEFKLTSQWLGYYARYFIGVTSLISKDLNNAQLIFEEILNELKGERSTIKAVATIRKRIKDHLYPIYNICATSIYQNKFRLTKDIHELEKCRELWQKANVIKPNSPFYLSMEAIYQFVAHRNITASRALLNKISTKTEAAPYYSLAFLEAYEGNISKAMFLYKKAVKLNQDKALSLEVEEFIDYILDNEPDKSYLHLCLALINDFKGDEESAKRDFITFIEKAGEDAIKYSQYIAELRLNYNDVVIDIASDEEVS